MSAEDRTLHTAIRTILQADGKIGTATLVAQLQALGFTSLPAIWRTLEQLERRGEVRSGGPATRRTWELTPPPQQPGRPAPSAPRPALPTSEPPPDLEDPATFLDVSPRTSARLAPTPEHPAPTPERPASARGPKRPAPTPEHPAPTPERPTHARAPERPAPTPERPAPVASATDQPAASSRRQAGGGRRREDKQIRHKGLTRCDYPERHMVGYMVRVAWSGERRQKFFADAKYGDRLGSLAAALAWRDQQERELGKPRTDQLVIGKAASNTGIPGVTRLLRAGHPILQVTWYEDGRQRRTSISIEKHGERAAIALARRIRAEAEQRRLGRPVRIARASAH